MNSKISWKSRLIIMDSFIRLGPVVTIPTQQGTGNPNNSSSSHESCILCFIMTNIRTMF